MATFDLICKECGHAFTVTSRKAIREKQKRCPQCLSKAVRQTFASYLRNGPSGQSDKG